MTPGERSNARVDLPGILGASYPNLRGRLDIPEGKLGGSSPATVVGNVVTRSLEIAEREY
jgi:hypothetical protein